MSCPVVRLFVLSQELKLLTHYHFWTLDKPVHNFRDAEESSYAQNLLDKFNDFVGGDSRTNLLQAKLNSSTGLSSVTVVIPLNRHQAYHLQFHRPNTGSDVTYQEILDMLTSIPRPANKNDWVDDITVDNAGRLVVTLVC